MSKESSRRDLFIHMVVDRFIFRNNQISRDKKFEYGLVLDWYGTVHISIPSGLLSLSETRNEVSRYGSSMALKTGQLTTISNDPRQYSLSRETHPYSKRSSLSREIHPFSKRDATVLQSLSRATHPYSKT